MYVFSKVHKVRLILSTISTPAYELAKFFIPILWPLTTNEYTI